MPGADRPPVIYGEVLFDQFEDGSRVLGGAPFNVAWHLHGFGLKPLFISRIGNDALGNEILETMKTWGMNTLGLQRDQSHSTGTVTVTIVNGQPSYDIVSNVAYDHISEVSAREILVRYQPVVFYHGSLIARTLSSQYTLNSLRQTLGVPSFVDINLRAPWWSEQQLRSLLHDSHTVKLNHEELQLLVPEHGLGSVSDEFAATKLRQDYALKAIIVTKGAAGSLLLTQQDVYREKATPLINPIDTVGAGDAFSAIALLAQYYDWEPNIMLRRASNFAAAVCEQRGATANNPDLYQRFKLEWRV